MLSPEQDDIIKQNGKFVVQACPGSGKTFVVAHRLAKRLKEWKLSRAGIATLSFTNVAHEEISRQLQKLGYLSAPAYPHFLGTIDSFINTWIFLPYGHLLMKCQQRPRIVGSTYNPWQPSGQSWTWGRRECNERMCRLEDFTFDIDGNLINLRGERTGCPKGNRPCQKLKKRFVSQGYATQADANYWAMKLLEAYPQIAKVLSMRFPEMIIDEAQDTSDVQMRIIDLLAENGLTEIMLIGDPDQAIYEWRDAKPEVFADKADAEEWIGPLKLVENWRSSQCICNATIGFSKHLSKPSRAVGENANCKIHPVIIEYDPEDFPSLQNELVARCQEHRIDLRPDKVAILVRTRRILRKILGIQREVDPWNHEITRLLATATYLYEQKDAVQALNYVRTAVALLCFGSSSCARQEVEQLAAQTMGVRNWRTGILLLLKQLPSVDLKLTDWVVQAKENLRQWHNQKMWPIADEGNLDLKVKRQAGEDRDKTFLDWPVFDFFAGPSHSQEQLTVETVHAAKGKTYDAVLFVVSDNVSRKGTVKQLGERPDGDEELRTVYVAITRPSKLLIVAVPKGTDAQYLYRFPDWMKNELPLVQLSLFS